MTTKEAYVGQVVQACTNSTLRHPRKFTRKAPFIINVACWDELYQTTDVSKQNSKGEDLASSYTSRIERYSNAVIIKKLGTWVNDSKHCSCSERCTNCRCLNQDGWRKKLSWHWDSVSMESFSVKWNVVAISEVHLRSAKSTKRKNRKLIIELII